MANKLEVSFTTRLGNTSHRPISAGFRITIPVQARNSQPSPEWALSAPTCFFSSAFIWRHTKKMASDRQDAKLRDRSRMLSFQTLPPLRTGKLSRKRRTAMPFQLRLQAALPRDLARLRAMKARRPWSDIGRTRLRRYESAGLWVAINNHCRTGCDGCSHACYRGRVMWICSYETCFLVSVLLYTKQKKCMDSASVGWGLYVRTGNINGIWSFPLTDNIVREILRLHKLASLFIRYQCLQRFPS